MGDTIITEGTRWSRQRETAVSGEGWVLDPVLIVTFPDGRTEELDRSYNLTRDDLVAIAGEAATRVYEAECEAARRASQKQYAERLADAIHTAVHGRAA